MLFCEQTLYLLFYLYFSLKQIHVPSSAISNHQSTFVMPIWVFLMKRNLTSHIHGQPMTRAMWKLLALSKASILLFNILTGMTLRAIHTVASTPLTKEVDMSTR